MTDLRAQLLATPFGDLHIYICDGDLPEDARPLSTSPGLVGIDTETTGLDVARDTLELVQVYVPERKSVYLVRPGERRPERLVALLNSEVRTKIFHYALFDLGFLAARWDIEPKAVRCTKVASKLLTPGAAKHSLAGLVQTHLNVTMSKDISVRTSSWGQDELTPEQLHYAVLDAVCLPELDAALGDALEHAQLHELAQRCFSFIPAQLQLDRRGVAQPFGY